MSLETVTNRTAIGLRSREEEGVWSDFWVCGVCKKTPGISSAGHQQHGWHRGFWTNALEPTKVYVSDADLVGGTVVEYNQAQTGPLLSTNELQKTMTITGTTRPSSFRVVGSTEGALLHGSVEGRLSLLGLASPKDTDLIFVDYNVQAPNVTVGFVGTLSGITSYNAKLAEHALAVRSYSVEESAQIKSASDVTEQMVTDSESLRTVAASVLTNMRSLTQRERAYLRKFYKHTDKER